MAMAKKSKPLDPKSVEYCVRHMEFETITEEPWMLVQFHLGAKLAGKEPPDILKGRVVRLSCGHLHFTKAVNRARCPRCQEMLRRSLTDGSEDYDAFRRHGARDKMHWKDDPLRFFHDIDYRMELERAEAFAQRERGEITQAELSKRLIEMEKNYD